MVNRREKYRQYHLENKEKRNKYSKEYYQKNRDKLPDRKEYMRQYYIDNKDKLLLQGYQYSQTDAGKIRNKKHHTQRRQLGFFALNNPSDNYEGHHISENFIIYIPKIIHRSITHSIWTWQGMDIINDLATEYI